MNPQTCPQCGRELEPHAPRGLCPPCLLRQGVLPTTPMSRAGDFVPPSVDELAGLFPNLDIVRLIGRGGMGAVYEARQPGLDRRVALKILPPHVGQDPAFAERFAREAQSLARLSHPHIVTIYDFGETGGLTYLVMEYVDGVDLRRVMEEGCRPETALNIVPQVCEALAYAHQQGVVHRDVKPENILVGRNGHVKIADFGLAKLIGGSERDFSLTGHRDVLGTLSYMAPEQVERPREVDHRADIYSLGVVFYELLTGELPLGRFDPPSHRVSVDVQLDDVVLRALEKEPQRRYQSAREMRTRILATESDSWHPADRRPPPVPVARPAVEGRRVSLPPVFGLLSIPLPLLASILFLTPVRVVESPLMSESAARESASTTLLIVWLVAGLVGSLPTILGIIGMVNIRNSAGRLYGMGLALGVTLFYPFVVADGIAVSLLVEAMPHSASPWIGLGGVVAAVTLNIVAFRGLYRALKR
ncbi:MAG: serine/threonine protein kinase [Planctomycetes bacterium]|nr:serine/threonine protein kinase [Planctomycetota bacterium]